MKAVASIALVAAQFLYMAGCQSLPSFTQSGGVKEILVRADVSLAEVSVNAGDKVRWINERTTPISIVFPQPVHAKLSCRNNFGGFYTGGIETTLGPGESASLCFHSPVSFQYVVRMQSALEDGKVNITGAIRVSEALGKHIVQKLPDTMTTDNRTQP
ncbi:MAG: hypothetical protein L0H94_06405 [Nitrospira sp.]|nr:hypothetical protein [Nitrospira sp.]